MQKITHHHTGRLVKVTWADGHTSEGHVARVDNDGIFVTLPHRGVNGPFAPVNVSLIRL